MPIAFSCESCGTTVKAPDGAAGRVSSCPNCKTRLVVPGMKVDTPSPVQSIPASQNLPVSIAQAANPVPAVPTETRIPCPFCGESIIASAKKCRFCDEVLDPVLRKEQEQSGQKQQPQVIQVITNQHATAASQAKAKSKPKVKSESRSESRAEAKSKISGDKVAGCSCLVLAILLGLGACGFCMMLPRVDPAKKKAEEVKAAPDVPDRKK